MKSKTTKSVFDIIVILLIFGIGQLIGVTISGIILKLNEGAHTTLYVALALLTANVFAIGLLLLSRYLLTRSHWLETVSFIDVINPFRLRWKLAPLMLIASFAGAIAVGNLGNGLGIENTLEDTMLGLAKNPIGILTIVFVGPLCEELVFRHAMLGGMLRREINPWIAILITSFLFGLVHFNPIQILCATVLGVMLGILYTKTQSIVPSLLYHIINNGISAVCMILSDFFDSQQHATPDITDSPIFTYSVAIVAAAICIPAYIWYWRKPTLNDKL